MNRVTIRVPATTANLGPGFDAFGCALSLYTDVTFEETDAGLVITGCDEAYAGPDNLAYTAYCAVLDALGAEPAADEFDQMEQLCAATGVAIPKNLAGLREKAERHTGVIEKTAMLEFVLNI